jgi:hypothetical protein
LSGELHMLVFAVEMLYYLEHGTSRRALQLCTNPLLVLPIVSLLYSSCRVSSLASPWAE